MSAWRINKNHIVYLIQAAGSRRISHECFSWIHEGKMKRLEDDAACIRIAEKLDYANVDSLFERYEESEEPYVFFGSDFRYDPFENFDPVQVLKSVNCYIYQCCEYDEFYDSEAYAFCKALMRRAVDALPGYDDAVWGYPEKRRAV